MVCGSALLWYHQNKVPHRAFLRTCDTIGDCLLYSLRTKSISKGEIKYLDVVRSLICIVPHKLETTLNTVNAFNLLCTTLSQTEHFFRSHRVHSKIQNTAKKKNTQTYLNLPPFLGPALRHSGRDRGKADTSSPISFSSFVFMDGKITGNSPCFLPMKDYGILYAPLCFPQANN